MAKRTIRTALGFTCFTIKIVMAVVVIGVHHAGFSMAANQARQRP